MTRPRSPHPQIHLPALDARDALLLVDAFERAIAAIWRTPSHGMAEILAMRDAARASEPVEDGHSDPPDDTLFVSARRPPYLTGRRALRSLGRGGGRSGSSRRVAPARPAVAVQW